MSSVKSFCSIPRMGLNNGFVKAFVSKIKQMLLLPKIEEQKSSNKIIKQIGSPPMEDNQKSITF